MFKRAWHLLQASTKNTRTESDVSVIRKKMFRAESWLLLSIVLEQNNSSQLGVDIIYYRESDEFI
jgi:hypothetical protein